MKILLYFDYDYIFKNINFIPYSNERTNSCDGQKRKNT